MIGRTTGSRWPRPCFVDLRRHTAWWRFHTPLATGGASQRQPFGMCVDGGPPVAGVLLAAGQGARFGKPKALAEFRGERLADRGVALLREGGAAPVIVVTGAVTFAVAGAATVHNPDWRTGMGSSLAVALDAMPADAGAAVIALVDQPLIGPEAVRRLIAAHRDGAGVAVAAYHGAPRNPVLLAREHWAEVSRLAVGDQGARAFLRAHPELVSIVECGDTGDPADADTPEDLANLARRLSSRGTQAPRNGPRHRPV